MPNVPSVVLATEIFEALSATPALRLTDLVARTGANKSTVFNVLRTLADRGYVSLDVATKTYSIGPSLQAVALRGSAFAHYARLALPHMERLVDEVLVTSLLGVLVPDMQVLVLEKVDSRNDLKVTMERGARLAAAPTAIGKAMLAFSPTDVSPAWTDDEGAHKRLIEELSAVRQIGYACSRGEYYPANHAVAAPVLDAAGHAVFAISVLGFEQDFESLGGMEAVVPTVRRAAKEIAASVIDASRRAETR
jgi:DNA-binding IclR family transcriptional regulator